MKLMGSDSGFGRRIREPTVNRPGLALAGFFTYFAMKRIQVLGSASFPTCAASNPRRRGSAAARSARRRCHA